MASTRVEDTPRLLPTPAEVSNTLVAAVDRRRGAARGEGPRAPGARHLAEDHVREAAVCERHKGGLVASLNVVRTMKRHVVRHIVQNVYVKGGRRMAGVSR